MVVKALRLLLQKDHELDPSLGAVVSSLMRGSLKTMAVKRKGLLVAVLSFATVYYSIIWMTTLAISRHNESTASLMLDSPSNNTPRCAICFFGLPRGFKDLVLASMVQNVFVPNAKYGCDYYIHYFHREQEPEGRAGKGGTIDPDEVLLMSDKIQEVAASKGLDPPTVIFSKDTDEDFWKRRGDLVEKFRTTKTEDGNYLYYPWKAKTYHYPESLDNIAR